MQAKNCSCKQREKAYNTSTFYIIHPVMRACTLLVLDPHMSDAYHQSLMHELRDLIWTVGGISIIEEFQKKARPDYQTYV
jgi:hypothetical protein